MAKRVARPYGVEYLSGVDGTAYPPVETHCGLCGSTIKAKRGYYIDDEANGLYEPMWCQKIFDADEWTGNTELCIKCYRKMKTWPKE